MAAALYQKFMEKKGSRSYILYSNGKKVTDKILLSEFREEEIGIFESLRTYRGKIFRLEEHLDRLFESAKTSGFWGRSYWGQSPIGPSLRKKLRRELELAIQAFRRDEPGLAQEDLFIRLTLLGRRIFVMPGVRVHPAALYLRGVALKTSPVKRSLSNASFPEVKTSSYQNAVLATLEPSGPETYEWLFLDQNGFVTEVRIGNLFIVKKGGARHASPLQATSLKHIYSEPSICVDDLPSLQKKRSF